MDFITGNDFDNIFLTGADGQLTDRRSQPTRTRDKTGHSCRSAWVIQHT